MNEIVSALFAGAKHLSSLRYLGALALLIAAILAIPALSEADPSALLLYALVTFGFLFLMRIFHVATESNSIYVQIPAVFLIYLVALIFSVFAVALTSHALGGPPQCIRFLPGTCIETGSTSPAAVDGPEDVSPLNAITAQLPHFDAQKSPWIGTLHWRHHFRDASPGNVSLAESDSGALVVLHATTAMVFDLATGASSDRELELPASWTSTSAALNFLNDGNLLAVGAIDSVDPSSGGLRWSPWMGKLSSDLEYQWDKELSFASGYMQLLDAFGEDALLVGREEYLGRNQRSEQFVEVYSFDGSLQSGSPDLSNLGASILAGVALTDEAILVITGQKLGLHRPSEHGSNLQAIVLNRDFDLLHSKHILKDSALQPTFLELHRNGFGLVGGWRKSEESHRPGYGWFTVFNHLGEALWRKTFEEFRLIDATFLTDGTILLFGAADTSRVDDLEGFQRWDPTTFEIRHVDQNGRNLSSYDYSAAIDFGVHFVSSIRSLESGGVILYGGLRGQDFEGDSDLVLLRLK